MGGNILTFHVVEQSFRWPIDNKEENYDQDDEYGNNYPWIELVLYICVSLLSFILDDLDHGFEGENPSAEITPVD